MSTEAMAYPDKHIKELFETVSKLERVEAGSDGYFSLAAIALGDLPLDAKACAKMTPPMTAALIRSLTDMTMECFAYPEYGLHLAALHKLNQTLTTSLASLQRLDGASREKLYAVAEEIGEDYFKKLTVNPAVCFELYHHLVQGSKNGKLFLRAQNYLEPFYVARIEAEPQGCVDIPMPDGILKSAQAEVANQFPRATQPVPKRSFWAKILGR